MADKRELILVRIAAITTAAQTAAGIKTCVRNRGLMQNEARPACVLLDGDERPGLQRPVRHGREASVGGMAPAIMRMTPELYVLMDELRPKNEEIGPLLNAKRIALVKAIANDAPLKALLGANGGIIYTGCTTDLKSGSALTGQMRLDLIYTYVFNPNA